MSLVEPEEVYSSLRMLAVNGQACTLVLDHEDVLHVGLVVRLPSSRCSQETLVLLVWSVSVILLAFLSLQACLHRHEIWISPVLQEFQRHRLLILTFLVLQVHCHRLVTLIFPSLQACCYA